MSVVALLLLSIPSWPIRIAIVVWVVFTAQLAASDVLTPGQVFRPWMPLLVTAAVGGVLWLWRSGAARAAVDVPVALLIGVHALRIVVEVLIHQAVTAGVAPPQMTWTGLNLDIVTGVTALLLTLVATRMPRGVLVAWNWMGLALLVWVVGVAALSLPSPVQLFRPDNTWITQMPFVWLPTVIVPTALLGHLVLFDALRPTAKVRS
jgi:hypothetical protein